MKDAPSDNIRIEFCTRKVLLFSCAMDCYINNFTVLQELPGCRSIIIRLPPLCHFLKSGYYVAIGLGSNFDQQPCPGGHNKI